MTLKKEALASLRIERAEGGEGRGRGRFWLAVAVAVAILALAGFWFFGPGRAAAVTVAEVREEARTGGRGAAVLNASGYVSARRAATVSSKITGKVVEVLVEEGMRVEEGQLLARLDDAQASRELALSEAELEVARRSLAETEVRLHEAELALGRTRNLVAQAIASQADLDASLAQVDSLKARLELGRQQITVAERAAALARQFLDDTVIRAPFAGVAISKDAQPGEMISPVSAGGGFTRTGICTIVDMASLEIEVDVNEAYINRVRSAQEVEAVLDAYPDWSIPARVITTIPTADREKATVKVRIGFAELDPRILPDMGVKVAFLEEPQAAAGEPRRRLIVPRAALRPDPDGGERKIVWIVTSGRLERRAVQVAEERGEEVFLFGGLAPGEQVVTAGPAEMAAGQRVRVRAGAADQG